MKRLGIIETVGKGFLTENIEGGEFSYIQALGRKIKGHFKIDLRFYSEESHVAILVETKTIYKTCLSYKISYFLLISFIFLYIYNKHIDKSGFFALFRNPIFGKYPSDVHIAP